MNRIDIVIATRNRLKKLQRTLDSIPKRIYSLNIPIFVTVVCDGDLRTFHTIKHEVHNAIYVSQHKGQTACRNEVIKGFEDAFIYSPDDIEFMTKSIETAVGEMMGKFPDEDGVIGFTQEGNRKFNPAGVALVGQKFLRRYKNRIFFNPAYWHFACQEVHWHAEKVGRFYLSKRAVIHHHNPFLEKYEMDQTHKDARLFTSRDHQLMVERKKKGLIWGYTK